MPLTIRQAGYGGEDCAACLAIRMAVFVDEQNVPPEEERDSFEASATHFLALWEDAPAGTARALAKGRALVKITRVAVLAPYRKLGLGAALMQAVEAAFPGADFILDAQLQAMPFYERLGYAAEGAVFADAGIPHRRMLKRAAAGG
jgi:predicted GNAT family N-acyltransferase